MTALQRFLSEIHRRSVWQTLTIYGVASWMVYEVVLGLYDGMDLPRWVPATALVLLLLGLPLVITTAVVQQRGPEVSRRERSADDGAAPASGGGDVATGASGPLTQVFTWRRAFTLVVLGFAGLGLAATGYEGMRAMGIGPAATLLASGALEAHRPIVLADLDNVTGDSTLAPAIREALRIDLMESPVISLVSPTALSPVLARMARPASAPLSADIAREAAIRAGWAAVFAGKVSRVGDTYMITVDLVEASTGELLAGFRESARGENDIIPAVGRLSAAIRAKVGESLKSVRSVKPLPEATTASLDALRAYAANQFEAAVDLDPDFATAWRLAATEYSYNGLQRQKEIEAMTRAYELRDRVNDRERGMIEGDYNLTVTGNWAASAEAYRRVLSRFPDDAVAAMNLGTALSLMRDFVAAESAHVKATRLSPHGGLARYNVAGVRYVQGRAADALAVLNQPDSVTRTSVWLAAGRAQIAIAEGEFDQLDSLLAALRATQPGDLTWANHYALELEGAAAAMRGRIAAAGRLSRRHEAVDRARNLPAYEIAQAADGVIITASAGLDATSALQHMKAVIADLHVRAEEPLSFPYGIVAEAYATANRAGDASREIAAFDSVAPRMGLSWSDANHYRIARARARLLLRSGEPEAALAVLRASYNVPCTMIEWTADDLCFAALEGQAHEQAGRPDSAIAAYERYLAVKSTTRHVIDETDLARVLVRLGALYERRGERAKAAHVYARFVGLWSHADPALQPRVDAVRRALARLADER